VLGFDSMFIGMHRNAPLSLMKEGARVHHFYGSDATSTYGSYEPRRANPSTVRRALLPSFVPPRLLVLRCPLRARLTHARRPAQASRASRRRSCTRGAARSSRAAWSAPSRAGSATTASATRAGRADYGWPRASFERVHAAV
jgi:hypothetical protein